MIAVLNQVQALGRAAESAWRGRANDCIACYRPVIGKCNGKQQTDLNNKDS